MQPARANRSLAAEAVASGRPAVSSSFRFHRPRGPICGRGHCFACEVETSAGRVLACQAPATASWRRRRDPLRPLGRLAERWPPWFYERRFLRTELVRRGFLEALRRASSAGRLDRDVGRPLPRRFETLEAATVVVGRPHAGEDALVVDLAAGDVALGVYGGDVLGALLGGRLVEIRFERLVVAAGGYERLPPVPGNDLPGVIGLHALEAYAAALGAGVRIGVWGPPAAVARAGQVAATRGLELVWTGARAPEAISGRGRVEALHVPERVECDLFVTGVLQPALELAAQAGATVELTSGELPILVAAATPPRVELRGTAAARSSSVPDVPARDASFACLCEDVRVGDLRACVADGFDRPELVKRRTGAMTGPCQGRLCAAAVLAVLREEGVDAVPTTARPLARPATLAELAADA